MQYIKFKRPYLVMGHLVNFTGPQLSNSEKERLSQNAYDYMKDRDGDDDPDWMKNKKIKYIRTLARLHNGHHDAPPKVYVVEHNGIDFVIGSKGDKEEPEFISLVPEELFEM